MRRTIRYQVKVVRQVRVTAAVRLRLIVLLVEATHLFPSLAEPPRALPEEEVPRKWEFAERDCARLGIEPNR